MLESLIVWTIISLSAFFIGRKFWRNWQSAISKKGAFSCGCGCSCDNGTCSPKANGGKQ